MGEGEGDRRGRVGGIGVSTTELERRTGEHKGRGVNGREEQREERDGKRGKRKRRKGRSSTHRCWDPQESCDHQTLHTVSLPPSDHRPLVVTLFGVGGSGGERLSISAYRQLHVCGLCGWLYGGVKTGRIWHVRNHQNPTTVLVFTCKQTYFLPTF